MNIREARSAWEHVTLAHKTASEDWREAVLKLVNWWAHLDSNQGPTGYEPVALTN